MEQNTTQRIQHRDKSAMNFHKLKKGTRKCWCSETAWMAQGLHHNRILRIQIIPPNSALYQFKNTAYFFSLTSINGNLVLSWVMLKTANTDFLNRLPKFCFSWGNSYSASSNISQPGSQGPFTLLRISYFTVSQAQANYKESHGGFWGALRANRDVLETRRTNPEWFIWPHDLMAAHG